MTVVATAADNNPINSLDEFLELIGEDRRLVQWLLPVLDSQSRWVLFKRDEHDVPRAVGHFWEESYAKNALQHYRRKYRELHFWLKLAEPFHNNYRT